MELSDKLKVARKHLGKDQKEMAELCGMAHRSWQRYEQGEGLPTGNVFKALTALGFDISWFFTDDAPMLLSEIGQPRARSGEAAPPAQPVDAALLAEVIVGVLEGLAESGRELQPDKLADLIVAFYENYRDGSKTVDKQNIIRLIKSAA